MKNTNDQEPLCYQDGSWVAGGSFSKLYRGKALKAIHDITSIIGWTVIIKSYMAYLFGNV